MTLAASLDLRQGDAMEILAQIPDGSLDTVVSDPAYGIDHTHAIAGTKWDTDSLAFDPALWAEVRRVTRPGSSIAVFGHTRTVHRVASAMEAAGLTIADTLFFFARGASVQAGNQRLDDVLVTRRSTPEEGSRTTRLPSFVISAGSWPIVTARVTSR